LEIRYACTADTDGWVHLLELVRDYFPGLDVGEHKKILLDKIQRGEALVADEHTDIAGAMMFSRETKEIEFLAVHPGHRRSGVGKALLGYMVALFSKGSVFNVTTYREGDERGSSARKFYQSLGFVPERLTTAFDYPVQVMVLKTD
jgi:ribosomal protein S18 acetylase RimI-like enzyme